MQITKTYSLVIAYTHNINTQAQYYRNIVMLHVNTSQPNWQIQK